MPCDPWLILIKYFLSLKETSIQSSYFIWKCFFCFFMVKVSCTYRCQFHQHFTRAFFIRIFCLSQNVTRKSCQNNVRTKNSYVKTLMKLTTEYKRYFVFHNRKMLYLDFLLITSDLEKHGSFI